MTDRRIGKQSFQVLLEDRRPGADQQSCQSNTRHDEEPALGAGEDRPQQDQQENARLHQRCRMQIGRDRCRRGHRMRQPEVEWNLRALCEGADQDQNESGKIGGVTLDSRSGCEYGVDVIASGRPSEQHEPDE